MNLTMFISKSVFCFMYDLGNREQIFIIRIFKYVNGNCLHVTREVYALFIRYSVNRFELLLSRRFYFTKHRDEVTNALIYKKK